MAIGTIVFSCSILETQDQDLPGVELDELHQVLVGSVLVWYQNSDMCLVCR